MKWVFWRSCCDITQTRTRWTQATGLHWSLFLEFCKTPCILAWNNDFHFKVCIFFLVAQADVGVNCHEHPFSKSISQSASVEIQNLLSLHSQFQCLGRKCHIHELSLSFIWCFQFVTAVFVISVKSRMCAASNDQLSCGGRRTSTRWGSQRASKRCPSASHDHKQIALS